MTWQLLTVSFAELAHFKIQLFEQNRPQAEVDESLKLFFADVLEDALPGQQLSVLVSDEAVLREDVVVLLKHRTAAHLEKKLELRN